MASESQLRVISGPPATGKTIRLITSLRKALLARDWSVRLLVPSATMAEHVRNQLAREGLVLRRNTVSTLSRFVDELALSFPAPGPAVLESTIATLLVERCPDDFKAVANEPGFVRHVASSADALALAGVSPIQLEGPLADVYGRLIEALERKQLSLRGQRLKQTTSQLSSSHLTGTSQILLDGFFSFSNTEREFLDKLATLIDVKITEPTRAANDVEPHRQPSVYLFSANDQNHEAHWIASEILRLSGSGVELRRIGIILRNPAAYAPLIESTFARLQIPSRSYLGVPLIQHPVVVFHRRFIEAVESGWENEAILKALRWSFTGLGGTPEGDLLEIQVKEALPSNSLEHFPQLLRFATWPEDQFTPVNAAKELKNLATLIEDPQAIEPSLATAWVWHQRTAALKALHDLYDATAEEMNPSAMVTLTSFWQLVEANLADATLHERDTRRNLVHIMDMFESRQWELDYVFAPGLSDGEFPNRFSPDPLLTEQLKRAFGMKTLEDRNSEEHFLYEMLLTRASRQIALSYPRINSKGDPVLASSLLTQHPSPLPPVTIASPPPVSTQVSAQLGLSYRPAAAWSASELESYLNCPWRHFAGKGLELRGLPETPAERLNPILLGIVAHETITKWTQNPSQSIESIADRTLEMHCRDARVPIGYHYERERINLLRNMRLYASNAPPVPPGWSTNLEQKFRCELSNGLSVRGQIDRYDVSPDGEIHAYDFKYSKANDFEEKYPIQGALYALALGDKVTRFSFIALRDQARQATMEGATLKNSIDLAKDEISNIVENVSVGKIPVQPRNPDNCQYCSYIDACRIRTMAADEEPIGIVEAANT